MKNILRFSTLSLFVFVLAFSQGCSKDEKPDKTPVVKTHEVSTILVRTAVCGGEVSANGSSDIIASGIVISDAPAPAITKFGAAIWTDTTKSNTFSFEVKKLRPNTEYFVRAYATNDEGTTYGDEKVFTTKASPEILTEDLFFISGRGLVVTCNIASDGGLPIKERGVVYGTTENPTLDNSVVTAANGGTGNYSIEIKNLLKQTYYFRAYAINDGGVFYGNQKTY